MKQVVTHAWDLSEAQALTLQRELAGRVERENRFGEIRYIAGVDVAYDPQSERVIGAAVALDANSLVVLEHQIAEDVTRFPYVPGLFSFRELPPIAQALEKLHLTPDLIVCDGQGIAHPRRFGLACHIGVLFDVATIGCAKTSLLGEAGNVGPKRGDHAPLVDHAETIGAVLRTQDDVNPVFTSIGHRISLHTACEYILRLCPRYRLPETTRHADQIVRMALKCR
jgi:deoxyribonuclease V